MCMMKVLVKKVKASVVRTLLCLPLNLPIKKKNIRDLHLLRWRTWEEWQELSYRLEVVLDVMFILLAWLCDLAYFITDKLWPVSTPWTLLLVVCFDI